MFDACPMSLIPDSQMNRAFIDNLGEIARKGQNYHAAMCFDLLGVIWSSASYHREIERVINNLSLIELKDIGMVQLLEIQEFSITKLTEQRNDTIHAINQEEKDKNWERIYGE